MTRRLNIVATANSYTGYGEHLRQIILCLDKAGVYATVRAIKTQQTKWNDLDPVIASRIVVGPQPEDAELIIAPPTVCPTSGKRTAYWTMNECTCLRKDQVALLNMSQVVIVPCSWNASCFSAAGVTPSIRIAHLGIDREVFAYREPVVQSNGVVFGCGGFLANGIHRKGLQSIVQTFKATFHHGEDVRLEIKCSPSCAIQEDLGDPRIRVLKEFWPAPKLADWYSGLTAFINVASGGWELMAHEAMAVGRPLIAPIYGGMADYFHESLGYSIPFKLQRAGDVWTHGLWGVASSRGLSSAMLKVASEPKEAYEIGRRASEAVSKLTWQRSTESLLEILDEFDMIPRRSHPKIVPAMPVIVQLGRYGDIINILPLARQLSTEYGCSVDFMVSRDYADVLDGVTYCNPIIWDGPVEDFENAKAWADLNWSKIIIPQLYPRTDISIWNTDAFNKESWLLAGALDKFGEIPLLFDRRNMKREAELRGRILTDKPCVLLSTSGHSSPFSDSPQFEEYLRNMIGEEFDLINISDLKADRLYDLLGLMEQAVCLITTDSAALHLAAASAIPVVALTADTPNAWHGTSPLCNVIFKVRYSEASKKLREIASAVRSVPVGIRIIHLFSDYLTTNERTTRRKIMAEKTWKSQQRLHRWCIDRVPDTMLPRMFQDPQRRIPYVRDLIDHSVKKSNPDDIIVLTNSDTCMASNFGWKIREHFLKSNTLYCYRVDFPVINHEKSITEIKSGKRYPGCDLFGFTPGWWEEHGQEFPDLLLGAEAWDWCMRVLMDETSTGESQAEFLIYHERHPTTWEIERLTLPSQKHNLALAGAFLKSRGINPKFPI